MSDGSSAGAGRGSGACPPCASIAEQLGLVPERVASVIDLSNATMSPPKTTVIEPPYRPGDHHVEAEAALRMWEDACDKPGGEYTGWYYAVSALIHAVLDVGEAIRDG